MLGLVQGTVELCSHEKMWDENAAQTIVRLKEVFGESAADVQHVGSTALTHIKAKPIIDLIVGVNDMSDVRRKLPRLADAGFIHRPSNDQPDYMMFILGDLSIGIRTHHIHIVPYKGEEWNSHVNFRDYMNAHPDKAKEYETLKIDLMNRYRDNRDQYTKNKASFIESILPQAAAWKDAQRQLAMDNEQVVK